MTKLYLIRHMQTEGNLFRLMQGHWDGDVTALGLRQIDALAERFRGVPAKWAFLIVPLLTAGMAGMICFLIELVRIRGMK